MSVLGNAARLTPRDYGVGGGNDESNSGEEQETETIRIFRRRNGFYPTDLREHRQWSRNARQMKLPDQDRIPVIGKSAHDASTLGTQIHRLSRYDLRFVVAACGCSRFDDATERMPSKVPSFFVHRHILIDIVPR